MATHFSPSPRSSIWSSVKKARRRLARVAGRELLIRRGLVLLLGATAIGAARPVYFPLGEDAPLWLGVALALAIMGVAFAVGAASLLLIGRTKKPSELASARIIDETLGLQEVVASGFAFERDRSTGHLVQMAKERATTAVATFDTRKAIALPSLWPGLRRVALTCCLALVVAVLGSYHPALARIMAAPPNELEMVAASHLDDLARSLDRSRRTTAADDARQTEPDHDTGRSEAERRIDEAVKRLSDHAREASRAARRGDRAGALKKLDSLNRTGREISRESQELRDALKRISSALEPRGARGASGTKSSPEAATKSGASKASKTGSSKKQSQSTKRAETRGKAGETEEMLRRIAEKLRAPEKSGREGTAERREAMEALARAVAQSERAASSLKSGRQQALTKQLAEALSKAGKNLGAGKRAEASKQLEAAIKRARQLEAMRSQSQRQAEALAAMLKAAGMLGQEMQQALAGKQGSGRPGAKMAQLGMPGKAGQKGQGGRGSKNGKNGSGSGKNGSGNGKNGGMSSTDLARALALRLSALGMTGTTPTGNPGQGREGSANNWGTPHKALPVKDSLRARSEVGISEGDLAVTAIQGLGRSTEPTKEYRDVYPTYAALAEESMADEVVPAAQRHVVRQYFESIRPGGGHDSAENGATSGE